MTTREPILSLSEVSKSYDVGGKTVQAVKYASLEVGEHACVGIVGESGSGKTTIARLILGLTEPDSGKVRFAGRDVGRSRGKAARAVKSKIGAVFQEPYDSLNPKRTVAQSIEEPLRIHRRDMSSHDRRRRALEVLDLVGLDPSHAEDYPAAMSGGQLQRVGIARALILEPNLVVLDEPTSSLDVSVQAQILNLLQDIQRQRGIAYLLISHDVEVVRYLCEQVVVMKEGSLVEKGVAGEVLSKPEHPYTQQLMAAVLPVPEPAASLW